MTTLKQLPTFTTIMLTILLVASLILAEPWLSAIVGILLGLEVGKRLNPTGAIISLRNRTYYRDDVTQDLIDTELTLQRIFRPNGSRDPDQSEDTKR
jgi:hypothetical protein